MANKQTYTITALNAVHGTIDVMYYGLSKLRAVLLAGQLKKLGAKKVRLIRE